MFFFGCQPLIPAFRANALALPVPCGPYRVDYAPTACRENPFEEREINFVVLCWVWHMQMSRGPVTPELARGQTLE